MKLVSAIVLLTLCQNSFGYTFKTKYLEVPVDHFSFANNATFKLKYLINDTYWIDNGPIFFYTGNEGRIETFAQNTGFMFDAAPQFNALIVFAEHRYYGESLPFGNLSFSEPKYLGYLTSTQALADYVLLIKSLQSEFSDSDYIDMVPVVAFGGSYGGMLSAWLRMKYPASVVGAIAGSAPIWQFQGLTPCENFNRIVTDVYQNALPLEDCSEPLKRSWKIIRNLTSTESGKTWLSNEWKLCTPLKTNEDIDELINWLTNIYVNMVMVNYPYPTSFLVPLPAHPVRVFCSYLSGNTQVPDKTLLTTIGRALEVYTNFTKNTKCNNIAQTAPDLVPSQQCLGGGMEYLRYRFVKSSKHTHPYVPAKFGGYRIMIIGNPGEEGWDFQACTEMIMPMCSTDQDMFESSPWNFTAYEESCFKKWKVRQVNPALPILEYGGKDIKASSNIVFSNGLLDPWSSGGVLRNVSPTVFAVIIPEGAHHLDLRAENDNDPDSVIEARKFHVQNIRKWLGDYYLAKHFEFFQKWQIIYNRIQHIHDNRI